MDDKDKDIEEVCRQTHNILCQKTGISPILKIKDTRAGRGHGDWYSVPKWSFREGKHFVRAYVVHEFAHVFNGRYGHGKEYQKIEDKLLSYFNLKIHRKRVYCDKIYYKGVMVYSENRSSKSNNERGEIND